MSHVWCADDTFFGDLILIGNENLIVDHPKEEETPAIRDALLQGQSPAAVLSSTALNIPLTSVTKIVTDLHDDMIEIHYKAGDEDKTKNLHLADCEKRDEVLVALKQIYGDRFKHYEEKQSLVQAIWGPVFSLTILPCIAWLLAAAAADLKSGEASPEQADGLFELILVWVMQLFGPTGIWVVAGILMFLTAVLLQNRVRKPPVVVTLQAEPYRPHTTLKLIAKYLALFALWAFIARVIYVS